MNIVRCATCDDYLGVEGDPLLPVDIDNHMRLLHPELPRPREGDVPVGATRAV